MRDGLEEFDAGTLEPKHTVAQDVSRSPNLAHIRTVRKQIVSMQFFARENLHRGVRIA